MRIPKVWQIAAVCVAAYALPLSASAQQLSETAPPPPRLEPLEEGEAPAITIRKPDTGAQTTEKRAPGGKVTEIKVISGDSTYYLKPNDPAGSALPGDAQSNQFRAPQWQVLEFDVAGSKEAKEGEAEQATAATPAPPAPSPAPDKK